MNEYDIRQLKLMLKIIKRYESGEMNIAYLIDDIDSLLNVLEAVDESWIKQARGYWWDLEQIYAVALDRKYKQLSEKNINDILESLDCLRKMIVKLLEIEKLDDEEN